MRTVEEKARLVDHILKKYCPRIEFDSYEDFFENFQIDVPEAFNFGFDVVDEWARVEPDKRALVWCDDHEDEHTFTFTEMSRLSNQAANAFAKLGIGKGDVVMAILRRRWEYWVCAVALCKLGATIIPATLQLTKKDIVYRVNNAQVKMLVCVNDNYVCEQVEEALPETPPFSSELLLRVSVRVGCHLVRLLKTSLTPSNARWASRALRVKIPCWSTLPLVRLVWQKLSVIILRTPLVILSRRSIGNRCKKIRCTSA